MCVVILGLRYCIIRLLEGPGIGFLNALHCLINGAVDSDGSRLFLSYMPLCNSKISWIEKAKSRASEEVFLDSLYVIFFSFSYVCI